MRSDVIMPKRTFAAILEKSGSPLVLDMVELPPVLEYGQVLVRILYSGICGSQIGEILGRERAVRLDLQADCFAISVFDDKIDLLAARYVKVRDVKID